MSTIELSYVLTTYNKLSYLKVAMKCLLENVQSDEEIVVIDGASTDGTTHYLQKLYNEGKIQKFISEPDKCEAHGFNKGFLLARGKLIKIITDDEAYYYPAIKACKDYMLLHPKIDVLGSNTAVTYLSKQKEINVITYYQDDFFRWKNGNIKNFAFCMTPVMIRKSSLALTGLLNIKIKIIDFEWTLRVTDIINLAWYTGFPVINVINNQSQSSDSHTVLKVWPKEWAKFVREYNWKPPKTIMRNYTFLPVIYKIYLTRWSFKKTLKTF